jgi:hypothetical protein
VRVPAAVVGEDLTFAGRELGQVAFGRAAI